jgi:hypothetical protein
VPFDAAPCGMVALLLNASFVASISNFELGSASSFFLNSWQRRQIRPLESIGLLMANVEGIMKTSVTNEYLDWNFRALLYECDSIGLEASSDSRKVKRRQRQGAGG